jgi:hypothetical protein
MFERDHLMRQINMLGNALAHALSLRAEHRNGEALKHLDQTFQDLTGDSGDGTSEHEKLRDLSRQPNVATDLAALLTIRGDVLCEQGKLKSARQDYESALAMYRAALASPALGIPWDIQERVDALKERLQDAGWLDDD